MAHPPLTTFRAYIHTVIGLFTTVSLKAFVGLFVLDIMTDGRLGQVVDPIYFFLAAIVFALLRVGIRPSFPTVDFLQRITNTHSFTVGLLILAVVLFLVRFAPDIVRLDSRTVVIGVFYALAVLIVCVVVYGKDQE